MTFTPDSFTKIGGIVVPSHPLESEDSAHFHSRIRTDCLGDCCCIPGPEIAIARWTDSDLSQLNPGSSNTSAILHHFPELNTAYPVLPSSLPVYITSYTTIFITTYT